MSRGAEIAYFDFFFTLLPAFALDLEAAAFEAPDFPLADFFAAAFPPDFALVGAGAPVSPESPPEKIRSQPEENFFVEPVWTV